MEDYIFDKAGNPITFDQFRELAEQPGYRKVGHHDFPDGSYVSTIWLGINTSDTHKAIFETMYFDKDGKSEAVGKWETEQQAISSHNEAVQFYSKEKV